MSTFIDVIVIILVFGLPVIPVAILWLFMNPQTFWQNAAMVIISSTVYALGLGVEAAMGA